jgi:hypothetical protein
MATGVTSTYDLPYPLLTDPVNVHEDIQSLAERLELILSSVGVPFLSIEVHNNSGAAIAKGDPVYITGHDGKPTIAKCESLDIDTFPIAGLCQSTIADGNDGVIIISGVFSNLNTSSYSAGDILYVGETGGLTNVMPTSGSGAIAVVAHPNASTGVIVVGSVKGNGTWGSLARGLS